MSNKANKTKSTIDISYAIGLEPKDAIAYFESKGRTISFAWQDVWQEAHAKAFTVAGMAKADLLADVQGHVAKALREGKTSKMFAEDITPMLKKRGWYGEVQVAHPKTGEVRTTKVTPSRVALIHRQNVNAAYNAGRYKQQMENKDEQPYWMYDAVMDQVTRPAHAAMDGTIFPADDPFWSTHYPPNGWGCRCKVTALSQRGFERMGGKLTKSQDRMVEREVEVKDYNTGKTQKRTVSGFKIDAKKGGREFFTDVGFSYNAGKSFLQNAVQDALPKIQSMPLPLAKTHIASMVDSPAFALWHASKNADKGFFPVATLLLGKSTDALDLPNSVILADPQIDMDVQAYKDVQGYIDVSTLHVEKNTLVYTGKKNGVDFIIKILRQGVLLLLQSFIRK